MAEQLKSFVNSLIDRSTFNLTGTKIVFVNLNAAILVLKQDLSLIILKIVYYKHNSKLDPVTKCYSK